MSSSTSRASSTTQPPTTSSATSTISSSSTRVITTSFGPKFSCGPAYAISGGGLLGGSAVLSSVNLVTGARTTVLGAVSTNGRGINALGYNSLDGYIYAMGTAILALAAGLIRIDSAGVITEVDPDPPRALLTGTYDVGDVDDNGQYWGTNGGMDWIKYDLNPSSPTYGQATFGTISLLNLLAISIGDWSFVQSGDGLFAVGTSGTATVLYKFDRTTKAFSRFPDYTNGPSFVTNVALGITIPRAPVWSATWSGQGVLYASESVSGQIWRFPVTGAQPSRMSATAVGPTNLNDGARCYTAPNP